MILFICQLKKINKACFWKIFNAKDFFSGWIMCYLAFSLMIKDGRFNLNSGKMTKKAKSEERLILLESL